MNHKLLRDCSYCTFFKLGFTPRIAEQPLQGIGLQKMEKTNMKTYMREPKHKRCLSINSGLKAI